MRSGLLERNLQALATHNPVLAERLRGERADSPITVSFVTARSGDPIPVLHKEGRAHSLHSRYDPQKEAAKLAEMQPHDGYVVVLGMGGGYDLRALLRNEQLSRLLVVEPDPALLRAVLSGVAAEDLLSDPRVSLLSDSLPQQLASFVRAEFMPFVDGPLRVVPLKARVSLQQELFSALSRAAFEVGRAQLADYHAHRAHGRQWFRNALLNVKAVPGAAIPESRYGGEAVVIAAGPSIEYQQDVIRRRAAGKLLICCDTALGALSSIALRPDIVVSIDSQQSTLLHFLRPNMPKLLAAGLSAPAPLVRATDSHAFFASAHPLELLLAEKLSLPIIDTSGGNVTHAACDLAERLGAQRIHLFGADYSYPFGTPYARGTYFYDVLAYAQRRTDPTEGRLYRFLYERDELHAVRRSSGYWAYESSLLSRYRASLTGAFGVEILRRDPDGTEELFPAAREPNEGETTARGTFNSHDVGSLLEELRARYWDLTVTEKALWKQLLAAGERDRQTLFTLVPLATHFQKNGTAGGLSPESALRAARDYALTLLASVS